jgi:outer membrane lipoprotein-sorting protein
MIRLIIASLILSSGNATDLLDEISQRYSSAEGIQWEIESVIYSEIFEEYDTTMIDFEYFPPDTFSISSDLEKIAGIGDTIWVMSERHKQVQKKLTDGSVMPYNFILTWDYNYAISDYRKKDDYNRFKLVSLGNVVPDSLLLITDGKNRIRRVQYLDSKGDQVTMSFKDENLKRPPDFVKFYEDPPKGFEFIDLTE